jgi:hypothetical protein
MSVLEPSTRVPTPVARTRQAAGDLALVVLAGLGALLYAGWFRPLWIDEVGQLALGVVPADSLIAFLYETSGPSINRGQTGLYNLVDWMLLQAFGANAVAMRLPSLVAGFSLLLLAGYFMRLRGFSRRWQALTIIMLIASPAVMQWTGQARIYAPLAAATMAMAVYYQLPMARRASGIGYAIAIIAFPLGAITHPYWIVFAVLLGLLAVWQTHTTDGLSLSAALRALPWKWLLVSGAVYLGIGALTWMRGNGGPQDLWEQHGPESAIREYVYLHLSPFIPTREIPPRLLVGVIGLAAVLAIAILILRSLAPLRAPLLLGLVAAVSSLLIALSNIFGTYWIESRQWVAGAALATVAWSWLVAEAWTLGRTIRKAQGPNRRKTKGLLLVVLSATACVASLLACGSVVKDGLNQWQADRQVWAEYKARYVPSLELLPTPSTQDEFNELATINVAVGGDVWPSVGSFYAGFPGVPAR